MSVHQLKLSKVFGFNFNYTDLFTAEGLEQLDQAFINFLNKINPDLSPTLFNYRKDATKFTQSMVSNLLITLAPIVEDFLLELFNIEAEGIQQRTVTEQHNPVALFKKNFILRRCKKHLPPLPKEHCSFVELDNWLQQELNKQMLQTSDQELAIALLGNYWLSKEQEYHHELNKLAHWCQQVMQNIPEKFHTWTIFRIPERLETNNLIKCSHYNGALSYETQQLTPRVGFKLTDPRMNAREIQDEVHYCIYCHHNSGDFCSKGFPQHKKDYTLGFKKNPWEIPLTGCPLEEKISEMNWLKSKGYTIAPLSVIMIDNPMCPATGHRICNDCMKACIYQKQEPVNIPQIETKVLTDVLNLPWGVEIYDLLTRWNPLRHKQWRMKSYNGLKIMVAGMGPAGFTIAHHLLQEGFAVVGIDGLKIEPIFTKFQQPIYSFAEFSEELDNRLISGFGGVMEYGITARWDKNFLKLIYLSLSRRPLFQVFGDIRFGGSLTVEDVWNLGFDHLVLALGAGLPKALNIPGSLAKGMRQANDFLMALHLGGSANINSLQGMEIRLPAVVIGGGLTGVDTATEVQAYYLVQVEKILCRYEELRKFLSDQEISEDLDLASCEVLHEFLAHGRVLRDAKNQASQTGIPPNFTELIQQWGGVTIVYRRDMKESPAYIHNHEELHQAFAQGIYFRDKLEPTTIQLDQYGQLKTLICQQRVCIDQQWQTTEHSIALPANSIFVATGTQPNIAYEFEHRGTFVKLGRHYQNYIINANQLEIAHGVPHCKDPNFGAFTSYNKHKKYVSLVGDSHQVFHGSVVKAIASGMRSYPKIVDCLQDQMRVTDYAEYIKFAQDMTQLFHVKLTKIKRCTEHSLELTIKAPLATKNYHPGQFYRLQNFVRYTQFLGTSLAQISPLALMPISVNKLDGTLKFIVFEESANSKLCALLQENEPISLMGPTGVKLKIASGTETVLIIGNTTAIPLVISYGTELRNQGNKIIFLALCDHDPLFSYYQTSLERSCDVILWGKPPLLTEIRKEDRSFDTASITNIMLEYSQEKYTQSSGILLNDLDRIYVVGKSNLLREFQASRKTILKNLLSKDPVVYGSVHGPMQCMLKGICAQCLQWQIDPETGQRTKAVFACSWQDQPLEIIDIDHIDERLAQNSLHEHLANLWVEHLLASKELNIKKV